MTTLEYALEYASRGWAVLPLHWVENQQCSCGALDCRSSGKHPLVAGGSNTASTDPQTITDWWTSYPSANVGIATGSVSGLIVVDVDTGPNKSGYASLAKLESEYSEIPRDHCVTTGSGGLHIYLSAPQTEIRTSAGRLATHIDIRGEGGLVVAPPSIHLSGNHYTWGIKNAD